MNASSVQQMLRRLDKAFRAFFRRLKAGEKPGFPRFKSRARFKSLEYRYGDGCKLVLDEAGRILLRLQNIGLVKVKYHLPMPEGARIKHVVIKRSLGKWYVCLLLELPDPAHQPHPVTAVGIDMGLQHALALSNGQLYENPRWLKSELAKSRRLQRKASRQRQSSRRQRKTYFAIARLHEKIANRRRDWWHKVAHQLADTYSFIAIEDLNLDFMLKNPHLARSASAMSLGLFRQLLTYKAEGAGGCVVSVDPKNTSQRCSRCGVLVSKSLQVRVHRCTTCGLQLDRDVNAARNILFSAWDGRSERNVAGCGVRALRSSPP